MKALHPSLAALAVALAAAVPGSAGAQVPPGDFELPPGPTSTPRAQGPVTDTVPAPRVQTTPTPAPTPAPTATPTPVPTPTATLTALPTPSASPRATAPAARVTATSQPASPDRTASGDDAPAAAGPSDAPVDRATGEPTAAPPTVPLPLPQPSLAEAPQADGPDIAADAGRTPNWLSWAGVALLALLAATGLVLLLRHGRRERRAAVTVLPEFRRPEPRPATGAAPPAPPEGAAPTPAAVPARREPIPVPAFAGDEPEERAQPLQFALEARKLSLSLVNATLTYRMTLTNSGEDDLTDLVVRGDMISAHASLPVDQQKAGAGSVLAERHRVARLRSGASAVFTGEFHLPLNAIRPIRQGDAAFFVPLARWKVTADRPDGTALIQTSVVGQRSPRPGAGLQPFRLDLGPRVYSDVAQRSFA